MTSRKDTPETPTLLEAAETLDHEVERNARLVAQLARTALDSEKGIAKAAELARETAASQERVGAHVRALLDAIHAVRQRNEAAVSVANEVVARIDERSEALAALLERFGELGQSARSLGELASAVKEGGGLESAERESRLDTLVARMQSVRDEARSLANRARDEGFEDVMRQADAIAQQVASVQNKLKLFADSSR